MGGGKKDEEEQAKKRYELSSAGYNSRTHWKFMLWITRPTTTMTNSSVFVSTFNGLIAKWRRCAALWYSRKIHNTERGTSYALERS